MIFLYIIFLLFIFAAIIIVKNNKQYQYNSKASSLYEQYDLERNKLSCIDIEKDLVDLSFVDPSFHTLFLKLSLHPSLRAYVFEPYITINEKKEFFEYGFKGVRYINLSGFAGEKVSIKGIGVKFEKKNLPLYGFQNTIDLTKKVLLLSPHADDAEIAAFGLYKNINNVTIVTLTTGENGVCKYCDFYDNKLEASIQKAQLRTFDALTTGILGDVDISCSLMLGYPGGSLKKMAQNKDKPVYSEIKNFPHMNRFRKIDHTKFALKKEVEPTYDNFYDDIKTIVDELRPEIIISPHPQIDTNTDHQQTTNTLVEVLKELRLSPELLLYTNHLPTTELYPFGAIFSNVSLPPIEKEFHFDSIYSFALDEKLQKEKYFALESMHDLRDSLILFSLKHAYKHFIKLLTKRFYTKDKSYFRRAIRGNELFFVVTPNTTPHTS